MNFLDLVQTRQSTRDYSDKPVSREVLEPCLEAARLAPSACNSQPWQFIVIDEPRLLKEVGQKAFSGIYASNAFAQKAPVLIIVGNKAKNVVPEVASFVRKTPLSLIDIGIACGFLALQAQEVGLGTCFLGWFNEKAVKRILKPAKNMQLVLMICLGYPQRPELRAKNKIPPPRDLGFQ